MSTSTAIILALGQDTPAELALRITMRLQMAESHAKKAVEYAFEIGQLLNEAKPHLKHGEWEQWLAEHCHLAQRTARAYMKLAKAFPVLPEAERQRVTDLPIREALKAISTDPTPPPPKEPPARRVNSLEERERVKSIFLNARNQLTKTAKAIDYAMPIRGGEVAALRKKLEAVLAQLAELQQDDAEVQAQQIGGAA